MLAKLELAWGRRMYHDFMNNQYAVIAVIIGVTASLFVFEPLVSGGRVGRVVTACLLVLTPLLMILAISALD